MTNPIITTAKAVVPNSMKASLKKILASVTNQGAPAEQAASAAERKVDAYLISYPKCGRTWLRLLMGCAIVEHFKLQDPDIKPKMIELTPLADLRADIPKVAVSHEGAPDKVRKAEMQSDKSMYATSDVILLVRDPRDTAISNHFHRIREAALQRQHGNEKYYRGEVKDSIRDEIGGIESILHYYDLWAINKNVPRRFLVVRYEDLRANTVAELKRVLEFVGLADITTETVARAVEYASFDNMRKMEMDDSLGSERLRAGDKNDPNTFKTRKGIVGDFVNHMSEADVEYVNDAMRRSHIGEFGYTP